MRNAIFPKFTSSLCISGDEEVHMPISNVSDELARLNGFGNGIFIDSHVSDDLHLGFTSLSTSGMSQALCSLSETNSHAYGQCAARHQKVVSEASQDQYGIDAGEVGIRSEAAKKETTRQASKKRKSLHLKQELSSSSPPPLQPMQAPVRRSHKLGDRVTALQQLVSPFGKTDTASVLQEATVYIKLLQEQIQVLSSPYFRYTPSLNSEGGGGKEEDSDLRSRGLCLVPVSSTLNLAKEAKTPPPSF